MGEIRILDSVVIDRIAAALAAAGIAELIVVTGYLANTVESHLAATAPLPVAFIRQPAPNGTAGALQVAAPALGFEPFLLSWGDIVTAPEHFDLVAASWRPELAAAIGVTGLLTAPTAADASPRTKSTVIADTAAGNEQKARILHFLGDNALSVLNPVMAACKAMADEFHEVIEKEQLAARLEPLW